MTAEQNEKKNYCKEDTFFRYYAQSQSEIYTYILTMVPNSTDAEDIFQETSSTMWRKFEEFKPGTSFTAWGCKIAYFLILEHRRKTARTPLRYSSETLRLLSETYTQHQIEKPRRAEALKTCIRRLSEKERLLINLRYQRALPVKQIAQQWGKSNELVYKNLAKIHCFLFECIQRNLLSEHF
ncbi:MAG: sigma-70 family RNA polymerase sigma factor [Anaerohalosphaeraceae bacterium]